jgi:hypothetical protein
LGPTSRSKIGPLGPVYTGIDRYAISNDYRVLPDFWWMR